MNYIEYVTRLGQIMGISSTDFDVVTAIPSIIDYAEGRCYRDLDLVSTSVTDNSVTLAANTRSFNLPVPASGTYIGIDQVNRIESSVRTPMTAASRDAIDMFWPGTTSSAASDRPSLFAIGTNSTIFVGPVSGASVNIEIVGRVKPTPLSAANPTTYLTTIFPDLFMAASLIFGCRYTTPMDAQKWEAEYQILFAKADLQSARQRFAGATWTSKRPEPYATPQRG